MRPRRRFLNATTLLSFTLFAATCALWVRSLRISHCLTTLTDLRPIPASERYRDRDDPVTHRCTATYTSLTDGRITRLARPWSTARTEPFWTYQETPLPRNTPSRQLAFDRYDIGPLHGWAIPLWPFALAFATLPTARLIRRARARPDPGPRCDQCGYDLRATPDRCPECGVAPAVPHDNPTVLPQ
jgi:hypothetical protein